jgi:hypothetical protein
MTNNELLDIILKLYLQARQWKLSGDPRHSRLTFEKVVKSQEPDIELWRIQILKDQLFSDKFLKYAKYGDEEPFSLTEDGVKAAQNGWYVPLQEKTEQEKIIRAETIKSLRGSKTALRISIFAFIIPTLISLYSLWTNKQVTTTEELRQLQKRIDKLESSKTSTKTTSNDLEKVGADSLKTVEADK